MHQFYVCVYQILFRILQLSWCINNISRDYQHTNIMYQCRIINLRIVHFAQLHFSADFLADIDSLYGICYHAFLFKSSGIHQHSQVFFFFFIRQKNVLYAFFKFIIIGPICQFVKNIILFYRLIEQFTGSFIKFRTNVTLNHMIIEFFSKCRMPDIHDLCHF